MNYFLGKTTYRQEDENGRLKTKNDHYLVNALSFTEAEARMAAMASSSVNPTVTSIRPVKIAEIILTDDIIGDELWFEAKTAFYSIDERSGKENKVTKTIYLNEESLAKALDRLTNQLEHPFLTYTIESIKVTSIQDYLAYTPTETTPATDATN